MKSWHIDYITNWKLAPLAYWVHIESDAKPWFKAEVFDPPAPKKFGTLGYPQLTVEFNGNRFFFTSEAQFAHFIAIMGAKLLPTTRQLSNLRGGGSGPNRHWLGRLPSSAKPWRYREKLVTYCKTIQFPT